MKSNTKKFLLLAKRLEDAIDWEAELFMKQRPFLGNPAIEPEIFSRTDDEIMEEVDIQHEVKEINQELKKYL